MKDTFLGALTAVFNYFKDTVKIRTIKASDLEDTLEGVIKRLEIFRRQYEVLTSGNKIVTILTLDNGYNVNDKTKPHLDIHNVYRNKLSTLSYGSKATGEERKDIMLSLYLATKDLITISKQLLKSVDKLLEDESVDVGKVRLSHVLVLGLIRRMDLLATWSLYWLAMISEECRKNKTHQVFKYRADFLIQHVDTVAVTVAQVLSKTGPFTFLEDLKNLKNKQMDMVMGLNATNIGILSNALTRKIGLIDNILSALRVLNIFSRIDTKIELWKHEKHLEDVEMAEWIEMRIRLLMHDLNNTTDSNEIKKIEKIAEAYSERLAKINQKIAQYEEGD